MASAESIFSLPIWPPYLMKQNTDPAGDTSLTLILPVAGECTNRITFACKCMQKASDHHLPLRVVAKSNKRVHISDG